MRNRLVICVLIICNYCNAQSLYNTSECTNYRRLGYYDFKKEVNVDTTYWHYIYRVVDSIKYFRYQISGKKSYYDSLSEMGIANVAESTIGIQVDFDLQEDSLRYNIYSCFEGYSSYMVIKTSDILLHEQIHFDICELYSRKMKSMFANTKFQELTQDSIYSIINICEGEKNRYNNSFDSCVTKEDNVEVLLEVAKKSGKVNKEWHNRLQKQLKELDKYKHATGVIYRKQNDHVADKEHIRK